METIALEKEVSMEEVAKCLARTKNNIAPGTSAFTGVFFKMFIKLLNYVLHKSIKQPLKEEVLPPSQRLGIVTLIPKGTKDKRYLLKWRLLSLLDMVYKLVSSISVSRLKPVLDNLINPHQKACILGKFICECIKMTYDIFAHAKTNNLPGILLLIDFETAFLTSY